MRVLVVWELGGGYGHVAQLPQLASQLLKAGHEPVFVLRDLSLVEVSLGRKNMRLLQAPLWLPRPAGMPPTANYAELLYTCGYLETERLGAVVRAWRELYTLTDPDVVLLNHAPTALLSSRGLELRTLRFGTGFECPPAVSPLPGFAEQLSAQRLRDSEQRVIEALNAVFSTLGMREMQSFAELLDADDTLLCTFAALDPYCEMRTAGDYLGPLLSPATGVQPHWGAGAGQRIFAYLKSSYPAYETVLSDLAASPHRVVVHTPNLTPQHRQRFTTDRLQFSNPVDIHAVGEAADIVVSHGGHGTTAATLLGGCAQLLLPMNPEQGMNARGIVKLGAGLMCTSPSANDLAAALARLASVDTYQTAASAFSSAHSDFNPQQPIDAIVRRAGDSAARSRFAP